ncbi:outer membrane protein [Hyphomonas sp. UBA4494]|jgi:opacity protein-like surface antigen|uniref:outer membrane protein n=1 Tax=Hyphomonas sp. UBA4494 TaxID=1946631 RepID=UPI0025BB6DAB|nr:outer membrane beta-barrel protein [Hyphomonas sp. UBA4494]
MNKISLGCLAAAVVFAPQSVFAEGKLYTDLVIGAAFPSEVETVDYEFTFDGDDYVGTGAINYNPGVAGGAEVGVQGLFSNRFRIGVSYDFLHPKVDNVTFAGTVNGMPDSVTFSNEDIRAVGIELGNQAHVIQGNGYFVFPMQDGRFEPYIGGGAGVAFLENTDTNFAYSGTAGVRYNVTENAYIGFRYRFIRINNIMDDLGLEYDPIHAHVTSFVFGAHY